jgi:hypothetical protein
LLATHVPVLNNVLSLTLSLQSEVLHAFVLQIIICLRLEFAFQFKHFLNVKLIQTVLIMKSVPLEIVSMLASRKNVELLQSVVLSSMMHIARALRITQEILILHVTQVRKNIKNEISEILNSYKFFISFTCYCGTYNSWL